MADEDESWRSDLHHELSIRRPSKRVSPYDTSEWKARRRELKEGADCILCLRFGVQSPAEVADHIVPAADSGDFEGELQPLCLGCHRIKRQIEGRWRKGTLAVTELNLATGKEALRLRAAAFGVGVDGFQLVRVK